MISILPEEEYIGIEQFYTNTDGVQGILRSDPTDFKVEEIAQILTPLSEGPFLIAQITATNWETNHLIDALATKLHISRKRINFAGTKDKRAKTTQYFSFYKISKKRLEAISLKDIEINDAFYAQKPLRIGNLIGNKFDIKIREISSKIDKKKVHQCFQPLEEIGGFPNFFGIQRFGIIRPITHIVGKYMVLGNFENAVMTYLTKVNDKEEITSKKARINLQETKDYKKALQEFPSHLDFELTMITYLIDNSSDYVGALKQLPTNLITMFVYAYQSYLFNKMLSRRIQQHIPINQAIPGDIILPVKTGGISQEYIPVTKDNNEKVNRQLKKGKGFVSGILLGSDSQLSRGKMGEIEQEIIDEEKVDYRNFIIPEIIRASSYGTRRALFAPLYNLSYSFLDNKKVQNPSITVRFELPKGCYATSFLREIIKADTIFNY